MKKYFITTFILFLGILLLAAGWYFLGVQSVAGKTLTKDVAYCNNVDAKLRFSCYRATIERYYDGKSLEQYLRNIENKEDITYHASSSPYAIFGANCHTFYHALGDFIATNDDGDISVALRWGPTKCTSGYMMGFYKRTALEQGFSLDTLKSLYNGCRIDERKSCAHEIGHLLHDAYTVSILKTLDDISFRKYDFVYPQEYRYKTFEESDLNAPFERCREIVPEEKQSLCYTGVGHNLFIYSEFSPDGYKSQFNECDKSTTGENKEQCFAFLLFRIGINDVAPRFLGSRFEEGREVCKESTALINREDFKWHCYRGVGGGIGLFVESEYPDERITEENIPQIKNVLQKYAELCEESEEEFVEECFRGLLGTQFRQFYEAFDLHNDRIEKVLPTLKDEDEVVG